MNTNEIIKQLLTNGVRVALVWLCGAVAAKNPTIGKYLTDFISEHGGVVALAASIAGVLFIYGQSYYTRMRSRLFAKVALQSPPGTPAAVVDNQIKEAPVTAVLTADPTKV